MSDQWVERALSDVSDVFMGQSPPGDSYNTVAQGLPFMQGSAEFGVRNPNPIKWCSSPTKIAEPGDLLVSVRAPVGDTNFADQHIAIGRGLAIIRANPNTLNEYLRLVIQTQSSALLASSGGGMFSSITSANLRSFRFLLPPLPVQRRIVDLMAHLDRVIVDLQNQFDSNMHLSDAIRNELFDDSGRTVPLVEVFEVTNGRQRSPKHASGKDMIQYVRAANVKDGRLELDNPHFMNFDPKEQLKYRLIPGDVLITEGCGSLSQIGASCRWMGEVNDIVCFQNHLLRLRPKSSEVDSELAYQWARHSFRSGRFAEIATGTSIFSLGTKRVERMPLPVACLDSPSLLQAASQSDALADKTFDELAALRSFRNALLGELSSGQTMIPNTYEQLLRLDA